VYIFFELDCGTGKENIAEDTFGDIALLDTMLFFCNKMECEV